MRKWVNKSGYEETVLMISITIKRWDDSIV